MLDEEKIYMSRIRKSGTNIAAMMIGVAALAAMAVWQFYLFATLKDSKGIVDVQGSTNHFWWGLGAALIACIIGFLVFSLFLQYDRKNELHITC
jgi:Ni/Fe-hydrogenase subunit HybB-like protein